MSLVAGGTRVLSRRGPGWRRSHAAAVIGTSIVAALALGAMQAQIAGWLLPILGAVVVLVPLACFLVAQRCSLACLVLVVFVVLGLVIELSVAHSDGFFTRAARMGELALLLAAIFVLAVRNRGRLPRRLVFVLVSLAAIDVLAFIKIGFPARVLLGGLNIYLHYFLLAIVVYLLPLKERDIEVLLSVVGIIAIAVAAVALIQFVSGKAFQPFIGDYAIASRGGLQRATAFFAWPNELALFCGVWFFLFYCRIDRTARGKFYAVVSLCLLGSMLLSLTRSAIAILFVLILVFEMKRASRYVRRPLLVTSALAVVVLSAALLQGLATDAYRYLDGSAVRVYYLSNGVRVWLSSPIVGNGYGRYGTNWAAAIESDGGSVLDEFGIAKPNDDLATTDSFLASLLPEFGALGVAILLVAAVVVARAARRWIAVDRRYSGYAWCLAFGALSIVGAAQVLYAPHTVVLWISLGMLAKEVPRSGASTTSGTLVA